MMGKGRRPTATDAVPLAPSRPAGRALGTGRMPMTGSQGTGGLRRAPTIAFLSMRDSCRASSRRAAHPLRRHHRRAVHPRRRRRRRAAHPRRRHHRPAAHHLHRHHRRAAHPRPAHPRRHPAATRVLRLLHHPRHHPRPRHPAATQALRPHHHLHHHHHRHHRHRHHLLHPAATRVLLLLRPVLPLHHPRPTAAGPALPLHHPLQTAAGPVHHHPRQTAAGPVHHPPPPPPPLPLHKLIRVQMVSPWTEGAGRDAVICARGSHAPDLVLLRVRIRQQRL